MLSQICKVEFLLILRYYANLGILGEHHTFASTMISSADTLAKPSIQLPGYAWENLIYRSSKTLVYRALENDSQQSVVIKYLRQDYPSFRELVQFQNQYTITKNLSIPGVIKPLGMEPFGNRYALIMEDSGCSSLEYYAQQQQMRWSDILGIALQLAEILHQLHQHQVVHRDIKPANILIHPDSKRVTLIDFSTASLRPEEQRSDLYALGVSLHQLGVNQLNPEVPSMVLNMVDKLMAKNTEDRYQSASGFKCDLEKWLVQWKEQDELTEFVLGEQDVCHRFTLSKESCGHTTEEKQIQDDRERKRVLNFANILQISQAFANTISLDDLLRQLTHVILQYSGADRCALILPTDTGDWQVRAITRPFYRKSAAPTQTELCREPLINHAHLPVKLIEYVRNVQETIVINDVENNLPVADDYLKTHPSKSALCLPLLNQNQIKGVVYLSRQLTDDVFTSDHVLMLNALCAQAAMALDNACRARKAQQHTLALEQSILALEQARDVLSENERRIEQQVTALVELSQSPSIMQGRTESAFSELTEITAATLQVERVSIWLLDKQHTQIECADLWMTSTQQHVSGSILKVKDYSAYFTAIQTEPILSAEDAWNDERTLAFREGYLDVLNVVSMLDASFYIDGKAQGVICCEQVGKKRSWSKADQNFVRSIANLIALTLETKRHRQKSKALKQALADLKTSQVKLVQSEKMSALGGLVAGVAHEINNPISCILGNIDATQNYVNDLLGLSNLYAQQFPNPGEEIEKEIETIDLDYVREDFPKIIRAMKDSGDRITSISKSLRTFSRADTDNKQRFNLQEGIESTVLILRHRLKANDQRPHIEVITDYGKIPDVNCFPGQLNQVFMNLFANAIDALDDASQDSSFTEIQANPYRITVQTSLDNDKVKIVISDNGPGMSEAVKNKVFDHLFTTKAAGKGTGLGLAIAQQIIVEAHDGTLDVQSQLGQGTTFSIQLPI